MKFDLKDLTTTEKQYYLQHLVAPRPICFASTIDIEGNVNLSPFSFFNLFSSNPPIVVFSPARRIRDNSTKHTLKNLLEVPEVVINVVSFDMVQQVSLASCDFEKGTDEFIKAGFTKEPASMVRPPMVVESKAKLECRVLEIKSLGTEGGAGNLVICEVVYMHIADELVSPDGKFDQAKLELVARLGGDWYCRVSENLFIVPKPNQQVGIGIDQLPADIRLSTILTGNQLAMLANVNQIPAPDAARNKILPPDYQSSTKLNQQDNIATIHRYAATLLDENKVAEAWQVLLLST